MGKMSGAPAVSVKAAPRWDEYEPLSLHTLLLGALDAFVERGYSGTTMKDIARRSGLSVPGLYHHYDSKQTMLVALLRHGMAELRERGEKAVREADGDMEKQFSALVYSTALFMTHRWKIGFILTSEVRSLEPKSRKWYVKATTEYQDFVIRLVRGGCDSGVFLTGHPADVGRAVWTMCEGIASWFGADPTGRPEEVARDYVRFSLRLCRARSEWAE